MKEAYQPSIKGCDWIVSIAPKEKLGRFSDYPDLQQLGDRWTATNLQNNYLRFNSELSQTELQQKLAAILAIPADSISVLPVPFLGTGPIY